MRHLLVSALHASGQRHLLATIAALVCLPALAQQSGVVEFDAPDVCVVAGTHAASSDAPSTCAPTGYRLYRNDVLVGAIQPGGSVTLAASGSTVIGVEAINANGAGPRVSKEVTIGPPPTVPGPVLHFLIRVACAETDPATCSVEIVDAP